VAQKIWRIILGLVTVGGTYLSLLYLLQNHFILFPDIVYVSPKFAGVPVFEERILKTADNTKIMTWYAKGRDDKPALLFFHGNAGQIATFAPHLIPYIRAGYTVLMPEYRGFASTAGIFSQKNMYSDAVAAYDFLEKQLGYKNIIVFGYSMGSAAACAAAGMRSPLGLILAAPFYSLKKVVSEKPVPGATMILKNELPSYRFIQNFKAPLFIVHGTSDTLIPQHHGKALFELAPSLHKELKLLPNETHNGLFFEKRGHKAILEWIQKQW